MNKIKRVFLLFLLGIGAFSCATGGSDLGINFAQISFDAWMDKYAANAEQKEDGVYIEFFRRDANWTSLPEINADSSWIRVNYTGYDLQGNVFVTRDSLQGAWLGLTSGATTRFVDDYFYYNNTNKLSQGMLDGVSYMRAGDSARIYMPASLSYQHSMANNSAYMVVTTTYQNMPIYMDIAIKEVVNNPYEQELKDLNRWVADNWGMTEADTVTKGLYMRITHQNPTGDTISTDSTIRYNYSSYFLDGQLYKTNIEDVAREWGYYVSGNAYIPTTITPIDFSSLDDQWSVYKKAILEMREGEQAEVVAVSWLSAGINGNQSELPIILPYESMFFEIEVLEAAKDDKGGE